MRRSVILVVIVILALAGSYFGKKSVSRPLIAPSGTEARAYRRIVSLAPSITEMLFTLGLGDRVIGVTRFCKYPPEALRIKKMGGFYDPNYEAIIAARPDLVILSVEQQNTGKYLTSAGLKALKVDHSTISGILSALKEIGRVCGAQQEALDAVTALNQRMDLVMSKTRGLPRRSVLISIARSLGSQSLSDIYIAGKDEFYDEMITLAGGRNAYQGRMKYPTISREGILKLNPEVIVDLVPETAEQDWEDEAILKEWGHFSSVDAVRNRRVHVFRQGFMVIPGPRFILTVEELARVIHPEVKWN
ncbi:MAG: ABC transporter substrate-binding protein [Deltaproteobacteria bacterium]|nr:ABC transporter substrate-binding protein [Deltaproteobacteria bacterium]